VGSALKAGADGYLTKDSLAGELVAAIRAVSAGEGYVSESLRIFC
jgi:DNA-binding NarL/FixJ family response regulator